MKSNIKKLGVIVGVDGDISQVGMYHLSNDAEYLWYGDVLQGAKIGAYLTILQNNVKIIASVVTEKVADQQNTIRSTEFDNRFSKNSINRIVHLKTKGVIENGEFQVTSQSWKVKLSLYQLIKFLLLILVFLEILVVVNLILCTSYF